MRTLAEMQDTPKAKSYSKHNFNAQPRFSQDYLLCRIALGLLQSPTDKKSREPFNATLKSIFANQVAGFVRNRSSWFREKPEAQEVYSNIGFSRNQLRLLAKNASRRCL
jgi:hypothetical protein